MIGTSYALYLSQKRDLLPGEALRIIFISTWILPAYFFFFGFLLNMSFPFLGQIALTIGVLFYVSNFFSATDLFLLAGDVLFYLLFIHYCWFHPGISFHDFLTLDLSFLVGASERHKFRWLSPRG